MVYLIYPKELNRKILKNQNYLLELLRKKILEKIKTNTQRNNLFIKIRYYLNKWKETLKKGNKKILKQMFLQKMSQEYIQEWAK